MPHVHDESRPTRDLAFRIARETARHSNSHPTRYIFNDGECFVDERVLRHKNAVIYNSPGSTMWLSSSSPSSRHASSSAAANNPHYYYSSTAYPVTTSTSTLVSCRSCYQRREHYYGGYCRDCTTARLSSGGHEYRRVVEYPERRAIPWRRT